MIQIRRAEERGHADHLLVHFDDRLVQLLKTMDKPVIKIHKQVIGHLTRKELKELSRLLVKARESLADDTE